MKKFFLFILMAFAVLSATSQKAVVESFEVAPMDVTAQQYARLDLHGEKCAIVKVRVIAEDVSFKGNLIGEPVANPGEYWVYLTDGTKRVQILSGSFLPFMYDFPEPLKGGLTYVLTLQAPQTAAAIDPYIMDTSLTNEYVKFQDTLSNKWGFKHNEREVIPAKFDNAGDFSEGLAAVATDKKCGYIDRYGTIVIPAKYEAANGFVDGLAGVKINDKWGYINKSGNLIIPAKFEGVWDFREDLAPFLSNKKIGFIDKTGSVVIPAKYEEVQYFSEGLAAVYINGKWGFIDKTGTLVIPAIYDLSWQDGFDQGKIEVVLNDRGLTINYKGEEAAPAYPYTVSAGAVPSGAPRVEPYSTASDLYAEDIALTDEYETFWVLSTKKYGFKNNDSIVIPATFDDAWWFSEGLASVKVNGKWGFVNKDGTLVIPAKFDFTNIFQEGLAPVRMGGKWGFIDKTGSMVIPAKYDDAWIFHNGKVKVTFNGREFKIDRNGNEVP